MKKLFEKKEAKDRSEERYAVISSAAAVMMMLYQRAGLSSPASKGNLEGELAGIGH